MSEPHSTRLLLVGEHRLFMESMQLALAAYGLSAVEMADSRDPAGVMAVFDMHSPELVLLDLDGVDTSWDLAFVARVIDESPVIALVGTADVYFAGRALEAGAACVFHKGGSVENLLRLVMETLDGGGASSMRAREEFLAALHDRQASERQRFAPLTLLTRREGEVLALLAAGNTAEEIAATRFVSLTTVRTQIRAILHKLGVRSQLAAVAIARDAGWPIADLTSPDGPLVSTDGGDLGHFPRRSGGISSILTMRS